MAKLLESEDTMASYKMLKLFPYPTEGQKECHRSIMQISLL